MSLLEIMVVTAIFAAMTIVINNVIFSAQVMWSGGSSYSSLESECLKITKQISADLEMSAVMQVPTGVGLSYTDRLPHVEISGGDDTDGYYGDSITFLTPGFRSNGEPIVLFTSTELSVDWTQGSVITYSTIPTTGGSNILRRTVTNLVTGAVTSKDLTTNLESIRFRDKDSDVDIASYYVVKYDMTLKKKGIAGRFYSIIRSGYVYLRNSRGAEDL